MCAFMMPVVKNDWDVYKVDKRSRNNSESSDGFPGELMVRPPKAFMRRHSCAVPQQFGTAPDFMRRHSCAVPQQYINGAGGGGGRRSRQGGAAPGGGRGPRRLSEGGRSHSYHVAPSSYHDLQYVNANNRAYHSNSNSRHQSQGSFGNFAGDLASPAKSSQSLKKNNNGPSKSPSTNSLNKFHNKVMDKLKSALNLRDGNSETSQNEAPEDMRSQS